MKHAQPHHPSDTSLEVFLPQPNLLYSLEVTAHLSGVSRRALLVYCRLGLVQPVFQAPYGVLSFSDETIHLVRQIEDLRRNQRLNLSLIKSLFQLLAELKRLRLEVRSLRAL